MKLTTQAPTETISRIDAVTSAYPDFNPNWEVEVLKGVTISSAWDGHKVTMAETKTLQINARSNDGLWFFVELTGKGSSYRVSTGDLIAAVDAELSRYEANGGTK